MNPSITTVYPFGGNASHDDSRQGDKTVTGGKGANLAEMASIGLPVPPGFTITTEECVRYLQDGADFGDALRGNVAEALVHIEASVGKRFGDASDPLLVSVRSGARVSMPGMMDTVLNLGLNDATVEGLAGTSGDERFAWDSYRRFIQMYSDVVLGLDHGLFEERWRSRRKTTASTRIRSCRRTIGRRWSASSKALPKLSLASRSHRM